VKDWRVGALKSASCCNCFQGKTK